MKITIEKDKELQVCLLNMYTFSIFHITRVFGLKNRKHFNFKGLIRLFLVFLQKDPVYLLLDYNIGYHGSKT